jgi:hypothetical protein
MWATMLHLAIGNALIGLFEGVILARLFSLKKTRTVALLIAANYGSAWAGGFLLRTIILPYLHMDLNTGWRWFWVLVFATYLLTLVLEWPLVALCLRGSADWFRKSLKGNLIIQTCSYVALFGWYWLASGTSLYTKFEVVSPQELSLPESVLLYSISDHDGNVYSRSLANIQSHRVFELRSTNENDRLLVQPAASAQAGLWTLLARIEVQDARDGKLVEIEKRFAGQAVCDWRASQDPPRYEGTWFNFGDVPRLGDAEKSDWEFRTGFWPIEGLRGTNNAKHLSLHLSFETPFGAWTVRNATQLPGGKVLFQLGEDQICVLDPEAKKVALLTHGRGPIAVIPGKAINP